jgi:hypothetical protein
MPSSGLSTGGTTVTLFGQNFHSGAACNFGDAQPMPAVFVSSKEIRCQTTPSVSGQVVLTISNDNVVYTSEGTFFTFERALIAQQVEPAQVSAQGGSTVHVGVKGLTDDIDAQCVFGQTVYVTAESAASGMVECVTPASISGNTTVQISSNHQDYTSEGHLLYLAHTMNVSHVMPAVVSLTETSTITVSVSHADILLFHDVSCFISQRIPATVSASGLLGCTLSAPSAGMHALEVWSAATLSHSGIQVEGMISPAVSHISPSSGTLLGGTVITVIGTNLYGNDIKCMFGEYSTAQATVVSSSMMLCTAPSHVVPESVSLQVSHSGSVNSNSIQFVFINPFKHKV